MANTTKTGRNISAVSGTSSRSTSVGLGYTNESVLLFNQLWSGLAQYIPTSNHAVAQQYIMSVLPVFFNQIGSTLPMRRVA